YPVEPRRSPRRGRRGHPGRPRSRPRPLSSGPGQPGPPSANSRRLRTFPPVVTVSVVVQGILTRRAAMTDLILPTARGGGNLDDAVNNRLLKERIIFLGSEVTDQVANRICAQLLLLAAEDPARDIWLYINSPGGSVYSGMAIYDTMQLVANDVATVAMGM